MTSTKSEGMDWPWWERSRGPRERENYAELGISRNKDPAAWRDDEANIRKNISFISPQTPPPPKPLAKPALLGSLIPPRVPLPPASHALTAEPEGPTTFTRQQVTQLNPLRLNSCSLSCVTGPRGMRPAAP